MDDIRAAAGDRLKVAWDCISLDASAKICAGALADEGGALGMLLGIDTSVVHAINPNVEVRTTLGYSIFGKPYERYGAKSDGSAEDNEFAKEWRDLAERLFREGKVKPARIEVNRGGSGLEGVLKGLDELRNDKVSGVKLIYTL